MNIRNLSQHFCFLYMKIKQLYIVLKISAVDIAKKKPLPLKPEEDRSFRNQLFEFRDPGASANDGILPFVHLSRTLVCTADFEVVNIYFQYYHPAVKWLVLIICNLKKYILKSCVSYIHPLIDQFRFHHFATFAIINAIEQHCF